mmetsp:Transcript_12869/g.35618  ORF Transcript_12869/g.35618 Transcript_12869/m.35618 type:complete len:405 (-) Transcript_12869:105-1319(-)|eukprot:CAMPEP_0168733094 /NCGR_PEP_ID=MMETSP0724-20121128/8109_1 /TAXON_ID=265536 /ORGANISM="Amphiprora sp., Strain CCMP467" /LENGTH=404 /DNA_ID=CAMNT_0008780133 /DNA_START=44 /DNA_END=1258 /DNA_ORIENTATION=+
MSTAMATGTQLLYRLYGVPLSQPTRSVLWTMLLLQRAPAELCLMVPGLDRKDIGARHESFRSKSKARSVTVPLLEIVDPSTLSERNGSTIAITESAAILIYLCETTAAAATDNNNNNSSSINTSVDHHHPLAPYQHWLYGKPGSLYKATIDSYLHWHHTNTRGLGRTTSTYLIPGRRQQQQQSSSSSLSLPSIQQQQQAVGIHKILKRLEHGWLRPTTTTTIEESHTRQQQQQVTEEPSCFIAGGPLPSIADLLCYDEIVQVTWTGLLEEDSSHGSHHSNRSSSSSSSDDQPPSPTLQSLYPNVLSWMKRMEQVPYHDPVHAALKALGRLVVAEEDPNAEQDEMHSGDGKKEDELPLAKRLARANKLGLQVIQATLEEMNRGNNNTMGDDTTATSATTAPTSKL